MSTMDAFRRLWEAYGRGRRDELLELVDDACELQVSEHAQARRGRDGLRELLDDHDRSWKSVMLTYESAEPIGTEQVVVLGHLTGFDHSGRQTLDERLICLVRFRDGRLVLMKGFGDVDRALAEAAAGLPTDRR